MRSQRDYIEVVVNFLVDVVVVHDDVNVVVVALFVVIDRFIFSFVVVNKC